MLSRVGEAMRGALMGFALAFLALACGGQAFSILEDGCAIDARAGTTVPGGDAEVLVVPARAADAAAEGGSGGELGPPPPLDPCPPQCSPTPPRRAQ